VEKARLGVLDEAVAGGVVGMGKGTFDGKDRTAMLGLVSGRAQKETLTQILQRMLGFGGPFVEFVCGA
jgi:hypothetical protein